MQECRCPRCDKLLGKLRLIDPGKALLEAWCARCKRLVTVPVEKQAA